MAKSLAPAKPAVPPKPRWAREINDEKWIRLNHLVIENWSATAILREIKIPAQKKRSLQYYARKFSARRRIVQFETLKDSLLRVSLENMQHISNAFRKIVQMAGSEWVKDSSRLRAFGIITEFTRTLDTLIKSDSGSDEVCEHALEVLDEKERQPLLEQDWDDSLTNFVRHTCNYSDHRNSRTSLPSAAPNSDVPLKLP